MGLLQNLFKKNNNDNETLELVDENIYYKRVPLTGFITLLNTDDIDYRIGYILRKLEGKRLKKETTFRDKFVKLLNDSGVYTKALETTVPGFPDSISFNSDNRFALIEYKVISSDELNHKVGSIFEDSQPPFYKEFLNSSKAENIFCLIKVDSKIKSGVFYYLFNISNHFVNNVHDIKFNEIITYTSVFAKLQNINEVVERFKLFFK